MRRWFFIGLLVLIFAACHRPVETVHALSPHLNVIDSVMWQQPDSAFSLLLAFAESPEAGSLDEFNGHYFQLLVSELLYKNGYEQTNRGDLLKAVDYFDSIGDAFLDARAHYIKGVGYYERDSVVEACEEYLRALEIKEESWGNDNEFIALIYTRLTELFSDRYLHEQAIYFGKYALSHYKNSSTEPWHLSWVLSEIGAQYNMIEQTDSAEYYYQTALSFLPDTNSQVYRDISTRMAYLSYCVNKDSEETLQRLYGLLQQSDSERERLARCLIIGDVYYQERQIDSAWIYLNRVFENTDVIGSKKQAAEWLVIICKSQERVADGLVYADYLVPFANQEENQSKIKTRLTELYNAYRQTILKQEHRQTVRNSTVRYGLTTVLFVALLLVVVALYHKSKGREKGLEKQIATERETHQMQQAALSGRLRSSNLKVQDLTKRLKQFDDGSVQQDVVTVSFEEEPICILVLERVKNGRFKAQIKCSVYESYALERRHLSELRKAADDHFNNFTIRLKKEHPRLTDMDLGYCCLLLLGLTNADISALMQREYNTVSERISKLKRIFGADCSITQFLRDFAEKPQHID